MTGVKKSFKFFIQTMAVLLFLGCVCFAENVESEKDARCYLVVDLSSGPTSTNYPSYYLSQPPPGGWNDLYKGDRMVFRHIPAGSFLMGSPTNEVGRADDEQQHWVSLTNDFYIGVFEVTQKQWMRVVGKDLGDADQQRTRIFNAGWFRPFCSANYRIVRGKTSLKKGPKRCPVDEKSFVGKLRARTGLKELELPTDVQWEYACRAGTKSAFNNGANLTEHLGCPSLCQIARYYGNQSDTKGGYRGLTTVGSYQPNAWGLYDMHGNVEELSLDTPPSDLWGPASDSLLPLPGFFTGEHARGGSYQDAAEYCRSAYCASLHGSVGCTGTTGFRLVSPIPKFSIKEETVQEEERKNQKLSSRNDPQNLKVLLESEREKFDKRSQDDPQVYLVIDLSSGAASTNYPVSYLKAIPQGGWSDEYKTTKLVLRKFYAGSYLAGSPENEFGRAEEETSHLVTLTKDFYMGVFEITQKQWEFVMGTNPSAFKGAMHPVEMVNYSMLRGKYVGGEWPSAPFVDADSFIGRIRVRTQMKIFDLPTDAQWEYACRAGTQSVFNDGKMGTSEQAYITNLSKLGRFSENQNDGKGGEMFHVVVGSYQPNAAGLYDMHGNVNEWCLDWAVDIYDNTPLVDPIGGKTGLYRILRGGDWNSPCYYCRSAMRLCGLPVLIRNQIGFRLAGTLD